MVLLCIETATNNCSVAISKKGKLLSIKENASDGYKQSENLHRYIDEIIKELGMKYLDIDGVSVSIGPGSYTGLRIGLAAAKGYCFALNKPLIAISTLEILARQIKAEQEIIIPALDARRMEVYSSIYNNKYEQLREEQAEIIETNTYQNLNKTKAIMIGNATDKCRDTIAHPNISYVSALPSAREMIAISYLKFQEKKFVDIAYSKPNYLK